MNVVYISSLSHSGSTVLNLCLGGHPRMIGLGEVAWMTTFGEAELRDEQGARCSCGRPSGECAFWGPVYARILSNLGASPAAKYAMILEAFEAHFGPEAVLVDSSKEWGPLSILHAMEDVDLQVLFMRKDVRAFTVSQRDALAQELKMGRLRSLTGNGPLDSWLYRLTIKQPTYLFWKWYLRNRLYERRLAASGLPSLALRYEEFALDPRTSLEGISAFLGLDFHEDMLVPGAGENHIFLGNHMAFHAERKASVRYDRRWFYRSDWVNAYAAFPLIARYNQRFSPNH